MISEEFVTPLFILFSEDSVIVDSVVKEITKTEDTVYSHLNDKLKLYLNNWTTH